MSEAYTSSVKNKLILKSKGDCYRKLNTEESSAKKHKKKLKKDKKREKKLKEKSEKMSKKQKSLQPKSVKDIDLEILEKLKSRDPDSYLTGPQKRLIVKNREKGKEADDLKKFAEKSHMDKVREMNTKMYNMTDINDIPKCSWTK